MLRAISVRLPVAMIEDLTILANLQDMSYQSLLKVFLAERLEKERALRWAGLAFVGSYPCHKGAAWMRHPVTGPSALLQSLGKADGPARASRRAVVFGAED